VQESQLTDEHAVLRAPNSADFACDIVGAMSSSGSVSRRSFLAATAAAVSVSQALPARKQLPIGLELFSVRQELAKDLNGTLEAVAKMGYQDVEFYSPYYNWTPERAKEVRKLMDDIGLRCMSTHNSASSLTPDGIQKAIDLNSIIGSKMIIMASAGKVAGLDGWKTVADQLTAAAEKLKPLGMRTGFHNHLTEFQPIDGKLPMEVLAANTPKNVVLQLDVGTCLEAGLDPIKWINSNPGRIAALHLKDWKPGDGYQVLFGEGNGNWKAILDAAESKGGAEFYLIEQEGSRFPPFETAQRCLDSFKKLRA